MQFSVVLSLRVTQSTDWTPESSHMTCCNFVLVFADCRLGAICSLRLKLHLYHIRTKFADMG